jgi:formamidopyrimidine-DNA glycosylase
MPELPEVETTRRGIARHLTGRRIREVRVHDGRLRWPVDPGMAATVTGQRMVAVQRRAKYLLLRLERGTIILHLGMSGSLRVLPQATRRLAHDHLELVLDSGQMLRLNDPRRFGSCLYTNADPAEHALLRNLAPEPLGPGFDAAYLHTAARRRRVAVKQLLLNGQLVTGVGNIYASEALFRARIRPQRRAGRLSLGDCQRLVRAVRAVLAQAIRAGGTTLRDYVGADGNPGQFRQKLYVYERAGKPCRVCRTPIRKLTQSQRSSYYCPSCQN